MKRNNLKKRNLFGEAASRVDAKRLATDRMVELREICKLYHPNNI